MLYERMVERERQGTPVRIGLIGIGTFGTQIAGQIRHMPGMRLAVIADLRVDAAAAVLAVRERTPRPASPCGPPPPIRSRRPSPPALRWSPQTRMR